MTNSTFKELALSFPETESNPHFNRIAFKVIKKRIFATLEESSGSANLNLSEVDQSIFCQASPHIYQVPNKWGLNGWTTFEILELDDEMVKDALSKAYEQVFV